MVTIILSEDVPQTTDLIVSHRHNRLTPTRLGEIKDEEKHRLTPVV
jgi:hypothetical protein